MGGSFHLFLFCTQSPAVFLPNPIPQPRVSLFGRSSRRPSGRAWRWAEEIGPDGGNPKRTDGDKDRHRDREREGENEDESGAGIYQVISAVRAGGGKRGWMAVKRMNQNQNQNQSSRGAAEQSSPR
ncbi:hypothetical protein GGR56DRAFT_603464 [Xylariaceae sp. FL0804]|nr:hypothetical protein GGR56DRAFT_603464 [Xylariaceae sp. FL0804]